jgi:cytochrome P450
MVCQQAPDFQRLKYGRVSHHTDHSQVLPGRIRDKYNLGSHFYIDLWPMADPFLAVFDPELAAQFTTDYSAPKYPGIRDFLTPLAGPGDMVSSDGPHWKKWRSIFNPGFAGSHLMSLVPGIVDYITVFTEKLSDLADKHEPFRLEEITTRYVLVCVWVNRRNFVTYISRRQVDCGHHWKGGFRHAAEHAAWE